jgi:GAF domain-containing protein
MDLYAQAIDDARDAGFTVCEALANELYARFWAAQKQRQLASSFIREASHAYRRWGAVAKCSQLEAEWPGIAFRATGRTSGPERGQRSSSQRSSSQRGISDQMGGLDLHSLLKANQLLAEEVHLESLLQKMLVVLLENAGAERAAIVLDVEGQLIVEAVGGVQPGRRVEGRRVGVLLSEYADEDGPLLPSEILEYTRLTRATVVLDDPAADERFPGNRYLRARRPKSVLCLPVVSQGRLVALVYLENNLLGQAFTAKQRITLELLGAQAAISLVNARLYESLEEKVARRTEELRLMTLKDGLTGIANRRCFDERLSAEWRRGIRSGRPLSLLMLDIDHFKQFNDFYGHLEGDQCIRAVAQSLGRAAGRPATRWRATAARSSPFCFRKRTPVPRSRSRRPASASCRRSPSPTPGRPRGTG